MFFVKMAEKFLNRNEIILSAPVNFILHLYISYEKILTCTLAAYTIAQSARGKLRNVIIWKFVAIMIFAVFMETLNRMKIKVYTWKQFSMLNVFDEYFPNKLHTNSLGGMHIYLARSLCVLRENFPRSLNISYILFRHV